MHGLGAGDVLGGERVAVGLVVVGVVGRRVADVASAGSSRLGRSVDRLGGEQRRLEGVAVVGDLAEVLDVPAVGLEALADVVGVGQLGRPVDRDVVVVVDADQPAEAEVAGERRGLVADALHEAAVAGDHVRVVVDERRRRSGRAGTRSAIAMPTASPKPWPSGPVVTSTPGVWPASGWPGVRDSELSGRP